MRRLSFLAAIIAIVASPAHADWTGKNAAGNTITFSNSVDCTIGTCIPIAALVTASGGTLYGTAGTANTNVLTVQGIASMTPFLSAQSGTWNIANITGTISLPTGAATAANQATANSSLATIASNTGGAIPAGSAYIGQSSNDPSKGGATPTFASLSMSTATTTQIIALSGTTKTYVTSLHIIAGGTANVTLKYGTGTNCGTGTTTLVGPYPLAAQAGLAMGSGTGAVVIVPSGQALCVTSDAAVQVTTGATYQQF